MPDEIIASGKEIKGTQYNYQAGVDTHVPGTNGNIHIGNGAKVAAENAIEKAAAEGMKKPNIFRRGASAVGSTFTGAVNRVGSAVKNTASTVYSGVKRTPSAVSYAATGTAGAVGSVAKGAGNVAGSVAKGAGNAVSSAVTGTVNLGVSAVKGTAGAAVGTTNAIYNGTTGTAKWAWKATPLKVKLAAGAALLVAGFIALTSRIRKSNRITEQKLGDADRAMEAAAFEQTMQGPDTMMGMQPVLDGPMGTRELTRRGQIPARGAEASQPVPSVAEGQQVTDLGAPAPGR